MVTRKLQEMRSSALLSMPPFSQPHIFVLLLTAFSERKHPANVISTLMPLNVIQMVLILKPRNLIQPSRYSTFS